MGPQQALGIVITVSFTRTLGRGDLAFIQSQLQQVFTNTMLGAGDGNALPRLDTARITLEGANGEREGFVYEPSGTERR